MKAIHLTGFGLDRLEVKETPLPMPGPGEVLVQFAAASLNPRDYQIVTGQFTPNVEFPLVPLSDGAATVVEVGEDVRRFAVGDTVTPLFFPRWISGEANSGERSASSGLEVPGVLRQFGVYNEQALARSASHLTAAEAACFPCAGLTAWTALVAKSGIGEGQTVLIQGTGGVALVALQFCKSLGAQTIIISSSDEKLGRAQALGADHVINYKQTQDWGPVAHEIAGHGVDAVIEIGGAGTLENSLAAIRHGGHVNVIGYVTGAEMGITVFPLIINNANLHGIGTGHRDDYEAMMAFVETHGIRPVIERHYDFEEAGQGLADLAAGGHFGKLVVDIPQGETGA